MATEQTPIEMAIEALEYGLGLAHSEQVRTGKSHSVLIQHFKDALAALRAMPTAESAEPVAEAMCGDHGGMQGCSCSSCGSPLGPVELTAYCNGCGIRIKWPMADGSEYMVTPPTKPDQPRMVLTDEECGEIASTWWVRSNVPEYLDGSDWFATFLRYARDNGYLALAKPTDTQ